MLYLVNQESWESQRFHALKIYILKASRKRIEPNVWFMILLFPLPCCSCLTGRRWGAVGPSYAQASALALRPEPRRHAQAQWWFMILNQWVVTQTLWHAFSWLFEESSKSLSLECLHFLICLLCHLYSSNTPPKYTELELTFNLASKWKKEKILELFKDI